MTKNPAGGPPDDNDHLGWSEWDSIFYSSEGKLRRSITFSIRTPADADLPENLDLSVEEADPRLWG